MGNKGKKKKHCVRQHFDRDFLTVALSITKENMKPNLSSDEVTNMFMFPQDINIEKACHIAD